MQTPEPFNIFSRRIDVRGVIEAARGVASEVRIVGFEDDWREITLFGPTKALRRRQQLRISHDSCFYDGPDWAGYVIGMTTYISAFSHVPRQADILRAVESFRFVLAFPDVDLNIDSDDERVAWVHAVCRRLDGIIFTPSMLLDANGRLLISSNGRFDPEAVLPSVPLQRDHPEANDLAPPDRCYDAAPPAAERVARRAIALTAVGNRGLIENEGDSLDSPDEISRAMLTWIHGSDVAEELEPEEWKVLQRPYGSLDSRATIDSVWRLEGLGVLLWALGMYELPPYDQLVVPGELFDLVGIFSTQTRPAESSQMHGCGPATSWNRIKTMRRWRTGDSEISRCDLVRLTLWRLPRAVGLAPSTLLVFASWRTT